MDGTSCSWIRSLPAAFLLSKKSRPDVKTAWLADQREQAWRKAYEAMRAKYTVSLPAPSKKQTATAPSNGA